MPGCLSHKRLMAYVVLIALALMAYFGYEARMTAAHEFYTSYYKTKIPAHIEITDSVFVHAAKTYGFRPTAYFDPCAIAVYRISDRTARELETRGVEAFESAQRWREIPDWFKERTWTGRQSFTYREWRPTPVPNGWTSEGSWFFCLPDDTPPQLSGWIKAAQNEGAFYTETESSGGLIVLYPKLKIVIYSYSHF